MTETTLAMSDKWDIETKTCTIHGTKLTYSRKEKIWYCKDCLYSAFLTNQAQRNAVKRYRDSDKGQEAQKRYEVSEKGQTARQRYLKSDKYKQRRREYNLRLKESLAIARAAMPERPSAERDVERVRTETLSPLVQDIREFMDVMNKSPQPEEVVTWGKDTYKVDITLAKAKQLIDFASERTQQ